MLDCHCGRPYGYKNERGWARIFYGWWCPDCVAVFFGRKRRSKGAA